MTQSKYKWAFYLFFSLLIFYIFFWRNICADFWFEDDPFLFLHAEKVRNPLNIFISQKIIKGIGAGLAFVPMQLFSYWIDIAISNIRENIWVAYFHQTISYLLSTFLVYKISFKISKSYLAATCISIVWALSPSTLAVLENISTRHYLEGLVFSLLSILIILNYRKNLTTYKKIAYICGIFISIFISMLYKEIYAAVLLSTIFIYAFFKQYWSILFITIAEAALYFIYRYQMLGIDMTYTMRFLTKEEYLDFIFKLPNTFSTNALGYIVYFLFIGLFLYELIYKRNFKLCGGIAAVLSISLLVIYPVSLSLYQSYLYPGTWYRGFFLLNTCLIGSLFILVLQRDKHQIVYFIILIPITLTGAFHTEKLWIDLKDHAEAEARYILKEGENFLFGTQAASWFIPGVAAMYEKELTGYAHFKTEQQTILQKMKPFERACIFHNNNLTCSVNNKYEIIDQLNGNLKKELNIDYSKIVFYDSGNQNIYRGFFDEAVFTLLKNTSEATLDVRGWCINTKNNENNLFILISSDDNEILAVTLNRHMRPDVGKAFKNDQFIKAGWNKTLYLKDIPNDIKKLSIWVYAPDNKAYFIDELKFPASKNN